MRKYKYSEKVYEDAKAALVRQVLAMAQEDAKEEVPEATEYSSLRQSCVEDLAYDYMADAQEQVDDLLSNKLRKP